MRRLRLGHPQALVAARGHRRPGSPRPRGTSARTRRCSARPRRSGRAGGRRAGHRRPMVVRPGAAVHRRPPRPPAARAPRRRAGAGSGRCAAGCSSTRMPPWLPARTSVAAPASKVPGPARRLRASVPGVGVNVALDVARPDLHPERGAGERHRRPAQARVDHRAVARAWSWSCRPGTVTARSFAGGAVPDAQPAADRRQVDACRRRGRSGARWRPARGGPVPAARHGHDLRWTTVRPFSTCRVTTTRCTVTRFAPAAWRRSAPASRRRARPGRPTSGRSSAGCAGSPRTARARRPSGSWRRGPSTRPSPAAAWVGRRVDVGGEAARRPSRGRTEPSSVEHARRPRSASGAPVLRRPRRAEAGRRS